MVMLLNKMHLLVITLYLLSTISVNAIYGEIKPYETENTYRLPNDTIPESYDVSLRTWIDEGILDFTGNVKIVIRIMTDTNVITLHQKELTIDEITLSRMDPLESIDIDDFQYDIEREFLQIPTSSNLFIGERYLLAITYRGFLRINQSGFYRSYYTLNETIIYQATTQFEPTNARHGFPCYDEPALKALFTIRITHGVTYNAQSNMPIAEIIEIDEQTVITEFQQTPLMSTYLIAFIVSDFLHTTDVSPNNGLIHRAFSRGNSIDETHLALQSGIDLLDALEDYLGVPYSLPKLDQFAIPIFAAGAMENWGIVTYRETSFLWNVNVDLYTRKTGIVRTISHELVHQWFGDLVSPRWWTYLWLNEGFASFYANFIVDWAYPEWRLVEYYVVNTIQSVLVTDSTGTSRPMSYYVETPSEISSIFDSIAYDKSGSILRMMMHAFGIETFRKGLNYYLTERAYKDASEEDLFAGIQKAVTEDSTLSDDLTVQSIFSSWSRQSGFPILYVNRNYKSGTIRIAQERYLTNPSGTIYESTYWIPLTYTTTNNPDFSDTIPIDWLPQNKRWHLIEQTNEITWSPDDWIIFNKQQSGYYRIQYDRRNWLLIANALLNDDYENVHFLNRAQLIDDAFIFARNNRLDFQIPLSIIRYLKYEINYAPWALAIRHLNYLSRYITGVDYYLRFRHWIGSLTEHYFEQVGIDDVPDEPQFMKYSRSHIVNLACTNGAENCRQIANARLRNYAFHDDELHQNIRTDVLCGGMRNADINDFNEFWERREYSDYITALGCMTDPELLENYLNQVLNTENLAANIRYNIFTSVHRGSYEGLIMTVKFLKNHLNEADILLGSTNNVNNVLNVLSQRTMNDELLSEFKVILEEAVHISDDYALGVTLANNNLLTNQQWLIMHKYVIDRFLAELDGYDETTTISTTRTTPTTSATTITDVTSEELTTNDPAISTDDTSTDNPTDEPTVPTVGNPDGDTDGPGIASTLSISVFPIILVTISWILTHYIRFA